MKKGILTTLLILSSLTAWAHGEDKPGPNGGHVRMPGGFHTELMITPDKSAHIFLLDIDFKNPTVKDSNIKMKFVSKKTEIPFTCSVMGGNHFHCIPTKPYPAKGELKIIATREKAVGQEVTYALPLKVEKPAATDPHAGH